MRASICQLDPRPVEVVGMNVFGAVELPRRRADLAVPPAQVADAPAHHEVDVLAAAGVGEIAVGGVADDDVLGFALAAEALSVALAEVHAGLLCFFPVPHTVNRTGIFWRVIRNYQTSRGKA